MADHLWSTSPVTRRRLTAWAKALGCSIVYRIDSGRSVRGTVHHEIEITAPEGYRLKGPALHATVIASDVDGAPIDSLYASALADMEMGIERCSDPSCEVCCSDAGTPQGGR